MGLIIDEPKRRKLLTKLTKKLNVLSYDDLLHLVRLPDWEHI